MTADERRAIGAVTIGQTPRDDVVTHLEVALGSGFEIIEAGALDGVDADEILSCGLVASGPLLVTRLRDGTEVRVLEGFVTSRLQARIDSLQDRVELIVLLCTGDVPKLSSAKPVLYPGPILRNLVGGLGLERLGVLTPAAEQKDAQLERWRHQAGQIIVESASPYSSIENLEASVEGFRLAGIDAVAMDCVGYTGEMKQAVRAKVGRPVLTATTLLARVVAELLA